MKNVRSMSNKNTHHRKFLPALLAKIKAIPQAFLLIVLGFSLLFSSQVVNAASGETGFAWNLIRKDSGQIACIINITHEGEPTSDEIKQTCGDDLFTGWQNGEYNLSKIIPTATPTAITHSWLETPDTASGLQMNRQLTYLAGKLIAAGYVDVSACNGSALLPNGYANPCGMTAARPFVFIWQNRFDEIILNAAVTENIPAYMFKNLLIQESQMWPQASRHVPPEYGIGQLTENGTDTLLMWNTPFFKKMCKDVLDVENCKKDYLSISASERAFLRGSTLIQVRADCANCSNRIDLDSTEKSIPVFAAALKANFHQIDQIAKNLTGKAAVSQMEWQEVWKLSTANYHAGPGCTSSAMRATLKDKKPLRWKYISKNFQAGCESAVDYVEHIITTEDNPDLPSASEIESARRVIYGLPALTPTAAATAIGTASTTPTSDPASTATATPGTSDLSVSQQLESAHVQNQLVLKIDPQNRAEAVQVIKDLGINLTTDSTSIESLDSLVVNVEASKLNTVLTALQNNSSLEFADPNYLVALAGAPDDPEFSTQSNLTSIQVPQAWDALPMMSQVLVAVIDSGVEVTHPDLSNSIWQNPAESGLDANGADKHTNNIDDDNNGYVDDWQGWNMVAGNNNIGDDQGHGTHLAGIIGAQANNGIGIAGIAPNARILPIKVLDNNGYGTHAMVAEGIVYAVDMGARVINLGFGGTGSSDILQNAIDYALAHNVIVVAAGGNKGDNTIYYPAGYSGVIAVSAVDNSFVPAPFSSYGDHISISAPGVDIKSTFPGGTYSLASGTSMSSAHVSGVAVLLAGQSQFSDGNFLTSALFNKALDLGAAGRDPYFGYGVVQAFDALNYGGPILPTPVPGDDPAPIPGGDVGMLTDMAGSTINSYGRSCGTATYNAALGGTSVPSLLVNNAVSAPVPLGFEFWYMGTRYTQVYVSSNGWLSFNDSGADSLTLNDLDNSANNASNVAARPILAPLWDNLGGAGAGSAASYTTNGTAPNRTFTFEWWNYQWNDGAGSRISMRVVLHEGTGIVDFMYYPNNANAGATASIGITGTANNSFISAENISACPTWSTVTETTSLNVKPPFDTVYTFTPGLITLNPPGNLNLTNVTNSSVTLNWTDNSTGEDGFSIYTSTDGINYTYFGQTAANTTIFNATGLANSANNYWKVYAAAEGNASTSASVDAPTALNFTSVAVTSMTLNWTDNSANDTGFYIFRSTDNINFSSVTKTIAHAASYPATGLMPNTTYYWRVQAVADATAENVVSAAASGSQITQPNTLPSAAISTPATNLSFVQGTAITFAGTGTDTEDGDITAGLQWTSSIDGIIGSGATFSKSDLSLGVHTVTATARDSFNGTASITITVTITDASGNTPALITIDTPANNSTYVQGTLVSFGGTATDTLDGDISANIQWSSNVDGALGSGAGISTSTLSLGTHRITASVIDSGGLDSSFTIRVTVTDAAGNTPPIVTIISPINGTTFAQGANILFTGQALIPVNGDISDTIQWNSSRDGLIESGSSFGRRNLTVGTHTITASATDASSRTGVDTITITVTAANADPHGGFNAITDKCSACHRDHSAARGPNLGLSSLTGNAYCLSCHENGNVTVSTHSNKDWAGLRVEASFELLCTQCHDPHGSNNLFSIRSDVRVTTNTDPIVTTGPINFTATTGLNSYDDGVSATANRLCVSCHVDPANPGGPMLNHAGGANHNGGMDYSGLDCVSCHQHSADSSAATSDGFMASCRACHSTPQDLGQGTPRRQIVGAAGDFMRASHHVSGNDSVTDGDCQTCHEMTQHTAGKVRLFNVDTPSTVYTLDYVANAVDDPSDYENFCVSCHDGDGRAGNQTPFSDEKLVPSLDETLWSSAMHNSVVSTFRGSCLDCHDSGHGSNKVKLLSPWNFVNDANPIDPMRQEERFCYYCHTTGGAGTNVQTAFSSYTNTGTRFFGHNVDQTNGPHVADEVFGSQFGGANRHTECGDCHGPHEDSAGINTAPATKLQNTGALGVEPVFNGIGAPTRFNFISQPENEYQVCLKCHSSYTTLPSYLPEGWGCVTDGCTRTFVADGLRKLTSINPDQIKDPRDLAAAFNPANASFHPLMTTGKNTTMPAGGFVAGWDVNSRVYCTDCHTNATPAIGADGPHGSPLLHILDGSAVGDANYSTVNAGGNDPTVPNTEICFKCHDYATYVTSNSTANTRFQDGNNLHSEHMSGGFTTTTCYTCHNSHGSEQAHLINFDASVVTFTGGLNSQTAFTPSAAGGTCALACHGTDHNETYP
ncbi:MAG: S8 family serine peptidase [Anaerolineales bacterium]|nr:S8 family serine peptidase [Anaerolineales bacterium]